MAEMSPYHTAVVRLIEEIQKTQADAIERAAGRIFESLVRDGVLHVFGSGHSQALAAEAFHRAGGLVPVNALMEDFLSPLRPPGKSGRLERVSGIAAILLDHYDVRAGEVLLIVSNSGINAVPVEMALEAKARGASVIALTSVAHARAVASRHPSGQRLFEVADIVIDNAGEPGDAAVHYEGLSVKVGATSLLAGAYIINSLVCRVVEVHLAQGLVPPVYMSANLPGGDEHNRQLEAKYRTRIKLL